MILLLRLAHWLKQRLWRWPTRGVRVIVEDGEGRVLLVRHRYGRREVEFEIDANKNGQRWTWTLRHNGSVSARGVGITHRPSGSFSRERTMVNLRGTDRIWLYARNRAGQTCSGALGV